MAQIARGGGGYPLVVVLTGSECTGKTTLARTLAQGLGAALSAEFAREYVERRSGPLDSSDVAPIARGQISLEDAAARSAAGRSLLIKDTDLASTVIYARHYFGACPVSVARTARRRLGDLYLLLAPDVPWVADGLQRDRPGRREEVHALFRRTLAAWGGRVIEIGGSWSEREAAALATIARARAGE